MVRLTEVTDPAIVNSFANHPEIAPSICRGGELDLTQAVRPPNVFLFGEHGGICWIWTAPDTFEGHAMFTESGRGRWAFEAGREAMRFMAERGATHLWGRVHPERTHIGLFVRMAGMRDTGTTHELDAGDGPVRWRIFNWRSECPLQS